jgi:hypothetical protein
VSITAKTHPAPRLAASCPHATTRGHAQTAEKSFAGTGDDQKPTKLHTDRMTPATTQLGPDAAHLAGARCSADRQRPHIRSHRRALRLLAIADEPKPDPPPAGSLPCAETLRHPTHTRPLRACSATSPGKLRTMTARPEEPSAPRDPGEHRAATYNALPRPHREQFQAEYDQALDAAHDLSRFKQVRALLQQRRLRAIAYARPGYEEAVQDALQRREDVFLQYTSPGWKGRV